MNILIETTLESYLIALIKNDQVKDFIFKAKFKFKSDVLAEDFQELMVKNQISNMELRKIYVTKGPGSFMGVRAGLIFANTLAKVLKIDIYVASSLDFLSGGQTGQYYIDAKGGKSFYKNFPQPEIKIVDHQKNSELNINDFIKNTSNYLSVFNKNNQVIADYLKEPKVG